MTTEVTSIRDLVRRERWAANRLAFKKGRDRIVGEWVARQIRTMEALAAAGLTFRMTP